MAIARLAASGANIVEIDFAPFYAVARMLYEGAWVAERMTVVEDLMQRNPEAVYPVTARSSERPRHCPRQTRSGASIGCRVATAGRGPDR